jgi:hypothetical protein
VFEGLNAHFSPKVILITDVSREVESGDMLIRTLPDGLRVGLIVDHPGYHESLDSIPARFEVKAHRAAPIDSRESSDFWRRLRAEFEQLPVRQYDALGANRDHKLWLSGLCSRPDEDNGEFTHCLLNGGLDSEFMSRFHDVVTQAAIALGSPPEANPIDFWMLCLCLDLLQNPRQGSSRELRRPKPGIEIVTDLLTSSAAYCSRWPRWPTVKQTITTVP